MRIRDLPCLTLIFVFVVLLVPVRADGPHDIITTTTDPKETRQWEVTGPWGGDVRTLVAAPDNSELLFLGTSDGQIFRSTDGAHTWRRLKPGLGERGLSIDSIAIDPREPHEVYVGPWHLPWKTTDGGTTWKQTGYKGNGVIDDSDIFGISIDPAHPELVYLNACSGIYRSNSAGEHWVKIPGIPFTARRTYYLLPHPTNPNVIFAGTSEGLWRTKDGGKRWMLVTSKSHVIRSVVITRDKPQRFLTATDYCG